MMSTQSFRTDFKFSSQAGQALLTALDGSQRVDTALKTPVVDYSTANKAKLHQRFDSLFVTKK